MCFAGKAKPYVENPKPYARRAEHDVAETEPDATNLKS